MTAEERTDWQARETIRAARFEAFVQRTLAGNRAAERRAREACERELQRRRPQLVLEFQI